MMNKLWSYYLIDARKYTHQNIDNENFTSKFLQLSTANYGNISLPGNFKNTPSFWEAAPTPNCKRTNNGSESFHSHYNEQFYSHHPNIYIFIELSPTV
jgi:hypothetical protein